MKYIIAITLGDAAGIGPEIIVKALNDPEIYKQCVPVVVGDRAPLADAVRFVSSPLGLNEISDPSEALGIFGTIDYLPLGLLDTGDWQYGEVSEACGDAAFQYIVKAIELAMNGKVHAVVTAPINKEAIHLAGHNYAGHTEIFADYTGTDSYGMLLTSDALRVIHVTTHVAMRKACDIIREHPERVERAIELAHEAMLQLGIDTPRIAVAGLNAHSSENGLFGDEEALSVIPAIEAAKKRGINAEGPIPPDTVFTKAMGGQYDIVVAMYHDQGHIPLKLSGFRMDPKTGQYSSVAGVNTTIGLPIIRTSVDHGTAFDRAGIGIANAESMADSINMACVMAEKRFPGISE